MKFNNSLKSRKLAEIIGIMMGDGCLYLDKFKKYQTSISFHKKEKDYLYYVKNLFEKYFDYKFCITEIENEFLLRNNSVFVGKKLISAGIIEGNKINNKIIIPNWIFKNKYFLLNLLRGFFDTDGCIYRKYENYSQIQFKLASKETINSLYQALIQLGFNPTKIQKEIYKGRFSWKIYIVRQKEIKRFFKEIKPANKKHIKRYNLINKVGTPRFEFPG